MFISDDDVKALNLIHQGLYFYKDGVAVYFIVMAMENGYIVLDMPL